MPLKINSMCSFCFANAGFTALLQPTERADLLLRYRASDLPADTAVTAWPNSGAAGPAQSLVVASGFSAPVRLASGGPGGGPAVRFMAGQLLQTAANSPYAGATPRTVFLRVLLEPTTSGQLRVLIGQHATENRGQSAWLQLASGTDELVESYNGFGGLGLRATRGQWAVVGFLLRASTDSTRGGNLESATFFNHARAALQGQSSPGYGDGQFTINTAPGPLYVGGLDYAPFTDNPLTIDEVRVYGALDDAQCTAIIDELLAF
jgi:hypothetical protein